jgi:hypothetical protein
MARVTILFGALLVLVGTAFFSGLAISQGDLPSLTALIPAFAGLPILLLGLLALRDQYRMHAMHAVAILSLLGFALPAGRLAMQLVGGRELNVTAASSQALMAALCGVLLLLCVKSFVDARRRQANASPDSPSGDLTG